MANVNKVFLIGKIVRDLELRYIPSGTAVCDMTIAVNEYTGKGDDRKETVAYIDVTVWGKAAENCSQYLCKGSSVHVEGRITMDSWEDNESGQKRTKLKVTAFAVQFLDTKQSRSEPAGTPIKQEPLDDSQVPF